MGRPRLPTGDAATEKKRAYSREYQRIGRANARSPQPVKGSVGRPRMAPADPDTEKKRARAREANRRRKDRLRPVHRAMIAAFLNHPCVDCGVQYHPAAMQPDHVRGKKYKISWYKDGNGSPEALREELDRCEVRCANCHCVRHALERERNA